MAARKTSTRGASKPAPRQRQKQQRQVPGWVWLFTGVVTGVFITFLYHLAELRFNPDKPVQAKVENKPKVTAEATEKAPRFDFYAVLPKMEVIVPKGEDDSSNQRGTTATTNTTTTNQNRNHGDEQYLLQAGSFRSSEDADRRRAELILQGYSVRVQPVELPSGDTWHRVMIGPFSNINALHKAQDKMASVGVETLPIKVKTGG